MAPRQQTGQQCVEHVTDGIVTCRSVPIAPTAGLLCCGIQGRRVGGAVERHTQPVPQAAADSPGRVDGDPDQQMEPRSASPQHEVEQSRGPVQEKQERLASVEVEANDLHDMECNRELPRRAHQETVDCTQHQSGSRFKLVISAADRHVFRHKTI